MYNSVYYLFCRLLYAIDSIIFNKVLNTIFQASPSILRKGRVGQCVKYLDYQIIHTILSPIRRGFAPSFVNYKKGCTRLAAASDKVHQLLAHGRWFSPGTPASSTTKTGRHDIAEVLLKVALNTIYQSINLFNDNFQYFMYNYVYFSFSAKPMIVQGVPVPTCIR